MPRVYAGLPLRGPSGPLGRDVLRGAELALERAHRTDLELVVAETGGGAEGDREELAVAAARRAAGDPEALAYLGDFHSSQIMETAPILGEAGLLQVSPVATFADLEG